jgi:hypothetical protein
MNEKRNLIPYSQKKYLCMDKFKFFTSSIPQWGINIKICYYFIFLYFFLETKLARFMLWKPFHLSYYKRDKGSGAKLLKPSCNNNNNKNNKSKVSFLKSKVIRLI